MSQCTHCGHVGHRASNCPRRRGERVAVAALALSLLSGCAALKEAAPQLAVVDTFCLNAQKRTWSMSDSPESIRDARVHNATIDKRCGVKKS